MFVTEELIRQAHRECSAETLKAEDEEYYLGYTVYSPIRWVYTKLGLTLVRASNEHTLLPR